ncbi:MAG: GWxTD domain-containing protein [Thermoanaerobaculia bacterium]
MRRTLALCVSFALGAGALSAEEAGELFAKAKEQYRLKSYSDVLATLDRLDELTAAPAYETHRAALLPALSFYRGAACAGLGRSQEARGHFEIYLTHNPDASLDPAMHPRAVAAALEEARKGLAQKTTTSAPGGAPGSLEDQYRAFRPTPGLSTPQRLEEWAEGPVRHFLTSQQQQEFSRLADPVSQSEFVSHFWKMRDSRPETPENEFRMEFEKRVAFSDALFGHDEIPGSMTDRGMVFILMGAPTYVGRKPLTAADDADDPEWLRRQRSHVIWTSSAPVNRAQGTGRADMSPPRSVSEASNWREVWHYRRQHLPRDVPYLQVDFDFVTKRGYGKSVLQRDAQILDTLERTKARLRQAAS